MRLAILGVGALLGQYARHMDLGKIAAFFDEYSRQTIRLHKVGSQESIERQVYAPAQIREQDFDYLIVFLDDDFIRAYRILIRQGVPKEKILHYRVYFRQREMGLFDLPGFEHAVSRLLQTLPVRRVLDWDLFWQQGLRFVKESRELGNLRGLQIDGRRTSENLLLHRSVYDTVFSADALPDTSWDIIFFTSCRTPEQIGELLQKLAGRARYLAFRTMQGSSTDHWLNEAGRARRLSCPHGCWAVFDTRALPDDVSVELYVAAHKAFRMPPHADCYKPIQAGRCGRAPLGFPGDDTGENISELNPYLNECTALYWIWRHARGQYIGLMHYRRYFAREYVLPGGSLLDAADVCSLLQDYDILLPERTTEYYPLQVRMVIANDVGREAETRMEQLIRTLLEERQPEYSEAFQQVMEDFSFYRCNMFVTRREILAEYCAWLFSFLIDAVRQFDYSGMDATQQRIAGYFAERMLSVWLLRQKLKIGELPLLEILS